MSFDSLSYLLFLPAVAGLHALLPHRYRWALLLLASTVFYASWNVPLTLLLYGVIGLTYGAGILIERAESAKGRRAVMIAALLLCVGLLLYFKYFRFLAESAMAVLRLFGGRPEWRLWDILLPVGVSFYTFQAMAYVIDVYRGTIRAERHFGYYALFLSFFPQLVAGPIERADALLPQLRGERTVTKADVTEGCRLLLSGFFRKVVLADWCGAIVTRVYAADAPDGSTVLIGTLLFAVQIYSDFAGYSEIARGSARLVGVRLMQNFDRPYLAESLRDFWRRWHISLGRWLTDYVYIPLGGSRNGLVRQILATLAVFAISGLWHGANVTFVVWGLLHGAAMALLIALPKGSGWAPRSRVARLFGILLTFSFTTLTWIFFRAESLGHAMQLLGSLFSPWNLNSGLEQLALSGLDALRLALSLSALPLLGRLNGSGEQEADLTYVFLLIVIALAWLVRLEQNAVSAFLYFQF